MLVGVKLGCLCGECDTLGDSVFKVSRFVLVGVMVSVCGECATLGDSVFKVSRFVLVGVKLGCLCRM